MAQINWFLQAFAAEFQESYSLFMIYPLSARFCRAGFA